MHVAMKQEILAQFTLWSARDWLSLVNLSSAWFTASTGESLVWVWCLWSLTGDTFVDTWGGGASAGGAGGGGGGGPCWDPAGIISSENSKLFMTRFDD